MTTEKPKALPNWRGNVSVHTCDCGQPAISHDGSGWFCDDCARMWQEVCEMHRRWDMQQADRERVESGEWTPSDAHNHKHNRDRMREARVVNS